MGAFFGAMNAFRRPLDEVAEEFGYGEDNILVLRGEEDGLKARFPETYRNILSCTHQKDGRTPMEYAQDLVASWLIEDSFLLVFQQAGLEITRAGADRNRTILPSGKTSTASDYLVECGGVRRSVELMNDYTGFWRRAHKLHLRDDKYKRLRQAEALLLAVSMTDGTFAVYDFRGDVPARYIAAHKPYGNKPAYELAITDEMLHSADPDTIREELGIRS